ncbi:uncharacterized protein LOC143148467 [Ptiloglossa arizonensis]|uniref:uncharacterized protein LOC143148467 n=1 Tax=Ptiloglossa arizonensis TaxID=3350558 RepID=UPI003FA056A9
MREFTVRKVCGERTTVSLCKCSTDNTRRVRDHRLLCQVCRVNVRERKIIELFKTSIPGSRAHVTENRKSTKPPLVETDHRARTTLRRRRKETPARSCFRIKRIHAM